MVVVRRRPDFLDTHCIQVHRSNGQRWRNADGSRLYEWDALHGHIEVYNKRGRHLGVIDSQTGQYIDGAKSGRRIDV